MLLSHALTTHKMTLTDAHTDYWTNVNFVTTTMASTLSCKMPSLLNPPADYNDYSIEYNQAKGYAINWTNQVLWRLTAQPQDVTGYNKLILDSFNQCKEDAEELLADPSDSFAAKDLSLSLTHLSTTLGHLLTEMSDVVTSIQNFGNQLPDLAATLQSIADRATNDEAVDQSQINALNDQIRHLNEEIRQLNRDIIVKSASIAALGVIGIAGAIPTGGASLLVSGLACGGLGYSIYLDQKQICADQTMVKEDYNDIQGLTQDVATLQTLSINFDELANNSTAAVDSLASVQQEWNALVTDLNCAVTDTRAALDQLKAEQSATDLNPEQASAQCQAILDDINAAIAAWDDAFAQATMLTIDMVGTSADIQFGMSGDQIQAAIDAAGSVDIITYLNAL